MSQKKTMKKKKKKRERWHLFWTHSSTDRERSVSMLVGYLVLLTLEGEIDIPNYQSLL